MINFFKRRMEYFTFWDTGFLKLYGAIAGAILGAYFPAFIKSILLPLLLVFLVLFARYVFLLFFKPGTNT